MLAVVTPELPDDGGFERELIATVQRMLGQSATPGATVALVVDGRSIFARGIGSRDVSGSVPLTTDARFYIYSVTKVLLAVIVLRLVEEGRVALDNPVQLYLPELPLSTPVTVPQLLTHTAGLPDYGALPAYAAALRADPGAPWSAEEFFQHSRASELLFAPGTGWAYSNIGFLIIRMLVEQVTTLTLRSAIDRYVVKPLGLQHTLVAESLDDSHDLTPGYSSFLNHTGTLEDISRTYAPGWVSHGVVISTAPDLARVIDAMFTGELLTPASLARMLEPTLVPGDYAPFRQPAYGLGLMIDAYSPYGLAAGHGGGGPGYSIGAFHFADVNGRRVTSIALANHDQDDIGLQIAFSVVDILAGRAP